MKTETLDYCRECGPFRAMLASLPCYVLAADGEAIASSEDDDVAAMIADALNEAGGHGNRSKAQEKTLGAAPRRRIPAGNQKPKGKKP